MYLASGALEPVAERLTSGVTDTLGERSSILAVGQYLPRPELRTTEKEDERDTEQLGQTITPERLLTSQGKCATQMGDMSDKVVVRAGAFGSHNSEDLDDKFEVFVIGVDETQQAVPLGPNLKILESD